MMFDIDDQMFFSFFLSKNQMQEEQTETILSILILKNTLFPFITK